MAVVIHGGRDRQDKAQEVTLMKYKWIAALCLALCLAALFGAHAETTLQEDQWLYRIAENGAAEILGYVDAGVERLSVPTKLSGAWVDSIGDGAFAETPLLRQLTIPTQVAQISDSAFAEGATPTIRAYNGSQALNYARSHGLTAKNLSGFDFFENILDLSEMQSSAWSVQGGTLRLKAPYAALIETGDKLYLPPCSKWPQGMPVRVDSVNLEGTTAVAAYTKLSLPEALRSYHAENVQMKLDTSRMILGEGVSLADEQSKAVNLTIPGEFRNLRVEKVFNDNVRVSLGLTLNLFFEATVDYEWLRITDHFIHMKQSVEVSGDIICEGEQHYLSRSFFLFRAPLTGASLIGLWADFYCKIDANGEAKIYFEGGMEQTFGVKNNQEYRGRNELISPKCNLDVKVEMSLGVESKLVLRVTFPDPTDPRPENDKFGFEIGSINGFIGFVADASYNTKAPKCLDLGVKLKAELTYQWYPVLNKNSPNATRDKNKKFDIAAFTIDLFRRHWEGDTQKWQDKCTHANLRTVDFYTGTSEIIEPITVEAGECIGIPKDPVRDGYAFMGWFTALDGGTLFIFSDEIEENITLYARWLECTPTPEPSTTPSPSPTVNPDETPAPTVTTEPTEPPIVTDWYPYENIPNAAESLALCEIIP